MSSFNYNVKWVFVLILLLAGSAAFAQLCQGSLGEPIVNITFGAGSNPGPPVGATTNLKYVNFDCPTDSFYAIRNNSNRCFGSAWHTIHNDHTKNPGGYFMLINASKEPSEFYRDTIHTLCPNTTYEFAAWVVNMSPPFSCGGRPGKPNLTFTIQDTSGAILSLYNTGDIASTDYPVWKQYGFHFTTKGNSASVVLSIKNHAFGGCGNDFAIDDITFRTCGPKIEAFFSDDPKAVKKQLCLGDLAGYELMSSISPDYIKPAFRWQRSVDNGASWSELAFRNEKSIPVNIATTATAGHYIFRLTVSEEGNLDIPTCRIMSENLTITVNKLPVVKAVSNSPVCQGNKLEVSGIGASRYSWTGPANLVGTSQRMTVNKADFAHAGIYNLVGTDGNGCVSSDSIRVEVKDLPKIEVGFADTTICQGDTIRLSCNGGKSYKWQPTVNLSDAFTSTPIARPTDTTIFKVIASDDYCSDSATMVVNVEKPPVVEAGDDRYLVFGQSVKLTAVASSGNHQYSWQPNIYIDNNTLLQPTVKPPHDTTYTISVVSNRGCGTATDNIRILVDRTINIPNVFSPNNDGINDRWNIRALVAYENYHLAVFNRLGRLVYQTSNYTVAWDGTSNNMPVPDGTYYFILIRANYPKIQGFVTIIR